MERFIGTRYPFQYIGTYHFDRQTGVHNAINLVYGDGSPVEDPKSVRLNYFGLPEESGFFEGKIITVKDKGNGIFFTEGASAKYPELRDKYFRVCDFGQFEENLNCQTLEEFVAAQNTSVGISLTPKFRFHTDAILIESADSGGKTRFYSGFRYDERSGRYVCKSVIDLFVSIKDREELMDVRDSPFFFLGCVPRTGWVWNPQAMEIGGEAVHLSMRNGKTGIRHHSFLTSEKVWMPFLNACLRDGPIELAAFRSHLVKLLSCVQDLGEYSTDNLNFAYCKGGVLKVGLKSPDDGTYWGASNSVMARRLRERNAGNWAAGRLICKRTTIGLRYALDVIIADLGGEHSNPLVVGDLNGTADIPGELCFVRKEGERYVLAGGAEGSIGNARCNDFVEFDGIAAGELATPTAFKEFWSRNRLSKVTPKDGFKNRARMLYIEIPAPRGCGACYGPLVYDAETGTYAFDRLLVAECATLLESVYSFSGCYISTVVGPSKGFAYRLTASVTDDAPVFTDALWRPLSEVSEDALRLVKNKPEMTSPGERTFLDRLFNCCETLKLDFDRSTLICLHTVFKMQGELGVMPVLEGPPGCGKSTLIELYTRVLGGVGREGCQRKVFVSAGWLRPDDLVGWTPPAIGDVKERFRPSVSGFYEALLSASNDDRHVHSVCFEEMNLSPVEFYFSAMMQLMSYKPGVKREVPGVPKECEKPAGEKMEWTENLLLSGTLNDDPTAHQLCDRFVDRSARIRLDNRQSIRRLSLTNGVRWEYIEDVLRDSDEEDGFMTWRKRMDMPLPEWLRPWCPRDVVSTVGRPADKTRILSETDEDFTDEDVSVSSKDVILATQYDDIDTAYQNICKWLADAYGLLPSCRVDEHVKSYILNRPQDPADKSSSDDVERDRQLRALDEALAVFLLPHADLTMCDIDARFFDRFFGRRDGESFCAKYLDGKRKEIKRYRD